MKYKDRVNSFLQKSVNEILKRKGRFFSNSELLSPTLKEFVIRYLLLNSKNVLHIGAGVGEERLLYHQFEKDVLWIEGNPETYVKLCNNILQFTRQRAICSLIAEEKADRTFFVSSNMDSSSLKKLKKHNTWDLSVLKEIKLSASPLTEIFSDVELENFDFWVIDVQGAELEVLKGSGLLLQKCKYLVIECSIGSQYMSGNEYQEVFDYLLSEGFIPLWENHASHDDVVFLNRFRLSEK